MVLGLPRLRSDSEKTSDEMQVSCGLDMKNCRKKQIFPFISVFCVCVFMYVYVCVCLFVKEYVVCAMFFPGVVLLFHSMHFFSCICNLSIQCVNICSRFKI